jgi:alpha-D-ribose 1-methylphosphonate 5-triphosphate synthase subunit PhnI
LLFFENKYNAAFFIEKNDIFITLFVIKGIDISSGEILITKIQEVQIQEISSKELHQYTRQYGKGFLSMLKEI